MEWLREREAVSAEQWQQAHKQMEAGLVTTDEVMTAVQSIRVAGLKGVVFFLYRTICSDAHNALLGRGKLSALLKQAFAAPAVPPHRK